MKKLEIFKPNCVIEKTENTVSVNGEFISTLIVTNLPPEMKNFKAYSADISISIKIETDPVIVKTSGYKKTKGVNEDDRDNSNCDNK